jgi:transposase
VVARREADRRRPTGDAWRWCDEHRERIAELLAQEHLGRPIRLKTVHRRLGAPVPFSTFHRFAVAELGFRRPEPTVPVADGEPGEEVQLDTGWVAQLAADARGVRRKVKAWIFTAVLSRHRFVWPIERETTAEAIAACEAAWAFFGGVFRVVVPDNTKAVVSLADPVAPTIVRSFLEYSQARGFEVAPARVRRPKDKARVERAVQTVRDDCFALERPRDVAQAREIAERWCRDGYGLRLHSTTRRRPREHFEGVERPALLPAPEAPYDVPAWFQPVVHAQFARVDSALYSVPPDVRGKVEARADRSTVRLYVGQRLVALHARVGRGERSTDKNHFPAGKLATASRDAEFFVAEASSHGDAIGVYAKALFADGAFFARVRCAQRLLSLVRAYGAERVEATCRVALAAELVDVARLGRMLEQARADAAAATGRPAGEVIKLARYLRPASAYRLRAVAQPDATGGPA